MRVTDSWSVAGMTILTLSGPLPKGAPGRIVIDGESFKPIVPMYAGDTSRLRNNAVGIRGEHDFTGKEIEFA